MDRDAPENRVLLLKKNPNPSLFFAKASLWIC
jgi:hypothetical protein